ncbi:MAG: aminotransferase class I/II-fold pyridoxal phosphate-dependent enzyme [Gemmatimonadaceae bacterium]|nr:aminotransferase class I/II-fold pyridoxal phosphate-dependent enzyme [Gemmatimonadaceae bacterium]
MQSLLDVLDFRAGDLPDAVVFRALRGDGTESGSLTFSALQARARAIAAGLADHVLPGDRVVLLVPPGLDYIAAFFGCLYAGAIAVPAYPPNPRRADQRVTRIFEDCGARVALVAADFRARLEDWLAVAPRLAHVTWLDVERLRDLPDAGAPSIAIRRSDLAMLQYTSGSTAEPRGVMLTHANLLHNLAVIHRVTAHREGDAAVFWLPPFHDMGLIGGILEPIYAVVPTVLMAPATFLQRPVRWLEAMSQYRATTSGAPNFAYDLCVDRITPAECDGIDLSRLRTLFNGAEPVRADAIERFVRAFTPLGLRDDVFVPCYGLAEATLLVSGGPERAPISVVRADRAALQSAWLRATAESAADDLVPSGAPDPEVTVAIVDPDALTPSADGQIGEIWVASESVAQGYWNRPGLSEMTFGASLLGSPHRWLRTGDLGVFVGGRLLVTGRLKDMVILEGRNHYPHDLEIAVHRSHAAIRANGVAAFAVPGPRRERLVIVAEVARHHAPEDEEAIFRAARAALAERAGVAPDTIVLVRSHTLPRTSSGKLQRRATRRAFLENQLVEVAAWRVPSSDTPTLSESLLAFLIDWIVSEGPRSDAPPDAARSVRDHGLDSLSVTRLAVALEERLGRRVTPAELWQAADLRSLARQLSQSGNPSRQDEGALLRTDFGPPGPASTEVHAWPEVRALHERLDAVRAHEVALPFFIPQDGIAGRTASVRGRTLINFAGYDYLGLSGDPRVASAATAAIETYGTSVSASRLVAGERPLHAILEREIASVIGTEAALTFVGGHQTNTGTISHLVGPDDVVLCDEFVHNSAMQGTEFSGARRLLFQHNDWRELDAIFQRVRHQHRRALVVIEGAYSADGDIPDLARFVDVKRRNHALLMVDEAHSIGVLGPTGRGLAEHAGVAATDVDIWMGTLSKALASCGGYIAGSAALIEYLRFTASAFVYSVGLAPANAGAALAALRILQAEPERVQRLRARAAQLAEALRAEGFDIGASAGTPVVPVILGDSLRAFRYAAVLQDAGFLVAPMVSPAVPDAAARLRFFVSALHTEADITSAVAAVVATRTLVGSPASART